MKNFIIVVLALTMLSGCAGFGTFSPGGQAAVDLICAPTPEQQQTAAIMLAALDVGWSLVPVAGAVKASSVLKVIQAGGCFLVAELNEAFKVIDTANEAVQSKQLKMVPAAPSALPEYAPLRKLIK